MISSADDLLKTRTIPELRSLVGSLAVDAESKQTELRLMVGSKYHDFIQSADAIAAMRMKTDEIGLKLSGFSKFSVALIENAKDLLKHTEPTATPISSSSSVLSEDLFRKPDGAEVWNFLEDCNIFDASKVVVVSLLILLADGRNDDVIQPSTFPMLSYISSPFLKDLTYSARRSKKYADYLQGSASAAFLRQTVLDDACLVLLEGGCNVIEKARTLAGLGMLAGLHTGELIAKFLESAEIVLEDTTETLGSGPGVRASLFKPIQ